MNPRDRLAYEALGRLFGLIEDMDSYSPVYRAAIIQRMKAIRLEYISATTTSESKKPSPSGPERMEPELEGSGSNSEEMR